MAGNTRELTERERIFTVNRFGSVYDFGDYLEKEVQDSYKQKIDKDIHQDNSDHAGYGDRK